MLTDVARPRAVIATPLVGASRPARLASSAGGRGNAMPTQARTHAVAHAASRARHAQLHHGAVRHPARHVPRADTCTRAGWYVQVGAFAEHARVARLQADLRRHRLRSCLAPRRVRGLDAVYVGPFATRSIGVREQVKLRKLLNNNNYLRHISAP